MPNSGKFASGSGGSTHLDGDPTSHGANFFLVQTCSVDQQEKKHPVSNSQKNVSKD